MVPKQTIKKFCNMAIQNILVEGTTDVDLFNRPFELDMLEKNEALRNELCDTVVHAIESNSLDALKLHKIGYVLIPKKSLSDFRKCALTEIYDEIVYLTLALIVAGDVETLRINKSKNRVFSYRYLPQKDGRIFDPKYNFTSFRETVAEKSTYYKNKVLVECDLSNFYDRLNIHRVESILLSCGKIDEDIIALINQVLLFWSHRDSYGLPVGSNASRILAEAALIEVDNYLISKKIDFCRFVDDYRIFAPDAYTAHSDLATLVHCISREGCFLNTQKTRIKDISDKTPSKSSKKTEQTENICPDVFQRDLGKIIRGYSGLIPTKFRELSENQKANLCKNDLKELLINAKKSVILEPTKVTELIRTIIAQEKYDKLLQVPDILKKFPQFIPYFIDVVLKKGEYISEDIRNQIQESFTKWLNDDSPEYLQVYLVRLFGSNIFNNKETLLNAFRSLRRNSGDYIGRALLEALNNQLTRGELLEIREYFYRADNWERRQIVKLINDSFSDGEKRPFFRDLQIFSDDIFLKYMISEKKKSKKSNKKSLTSESTPQKS